MIRRKSWLKITGAGILALAVIIVAVIARRPTGTLSGEQGAGNSATQAKAQDTRPIKLLEEAIGFSTSSDSAPPQYAAVVERCQQILKEYPDSPQAEQAEELLQKVPEGFVRRYEELERAQAQYANGPKVRKSRPLRRSTPRRDVKVDDEDVHP